VAKYQTADGWKSLRQVANTFIPYFVLWYVMYRSLEVSYWLTLALAPLAGGFLVRIFIIFHDCGHESFFNSARANHILGSIAGVLAFTPYYAWRHAHAVHHATAGNLDRRGVGDVLTLTVKEYQQRSWWGRLAYRVYRNPLVMLLIGSQIVFLIVHRIPPRAAKKRERNSVHWTNLALLIQIVGLSLLIGFDKFVLVQLPLNVIAGIVGVWMFYVQHQFEGTYWTRQPQWDYVTAALRGSSYYKLPKVLQWFTGNIGLHHLHHLSPRIPNYNLQPCLDANPPFQQVDALTLRASFKSMFLKLWDEEQGRLVGFKHLAPPRVEQGGRA